jgi:hypothetical protein
MNFFFLLGFFLLFNSAWSRELSTEQKSYWNKLLHYRTNSFGQLESEVDSVGFCISPIGKKSPEAEFEAMITGLNSDKGQSVVCKFPLRYQWLKKNVANHWNFTTKECDIYQSFVGKLVAKNLSLVFSSFYVNNPGSTFGHTFLRVGRYRDFRHNELLDYAINFSAQDSKDHVFFYMVKGLSGFYPGKFSVAPYYYKIREYNDHEFRDIWDYDLGLNQEQIDRVIDHVWEMADVHFDYYYFTENCSYHVLGLLNVAYDDVDLLKGLSPIYVLPIDTVKEMKKLKLITDRKVRVSAYGKLLKETEGLSDKKLEIVKSMAQNPHLSQQLPAGLSDKESADLLDASLSAIDYLKADKILLNEKIATEEREKLLLLRAENPHISEDLTFDLSKMKAPDESHHSSRLGFFAGDRYHQGRFSGLEWRAAQHDLLDPSAGQLKHSQVIIFDIKFRYQEVDFKSQHLVMDRFRMIDLKKYQPSDFWNSSISFDLGIGFDQRRDCLSQNCVDPVVTFGVGSSVEIFQDQVLSVLAGGSYLYDSFYQNHSLLSLGPRLYWLVLKDKYSLGVEAGYFMPTTLFEDWLKRRVVYGADFRFFLSPNKSLFFKTNHMDQDIGSEHEAQFGVYFYH